MRALREMLARRRAVVVTLKRPPSNPETDPMTWPGWTDVLPLLAALLAAVVALVGGLAAMARMARPWMREAAKEATEALYDRLKSNDFKHLEDRIGEGLRNVSDRLDRAREDRAAQRKDFGDRLERTEARILEAVRSSSTLSKDAPGDT